MSKWAARAAPWLFTFVLIVIWEAVCVVFRNPTFFLPPPTAIARAFVEFWPAIYRNSLITLWTTMLGFALAVGFGLLLGLLVGWSRTIYAGLYPLMVGFNAIPKVAVVPILVLWFGIGIVPAVLTAFLISFFPIVVNVATGLATIEPELEDVLKALGATKLDIMRKVGIPRALPYFFGSLKVAITLAFVGSVISESIASNYGIEPNAASASAIPSAADLCRSRCAGHRRDRDVLGDGVVGNAHDRLGPTVRLRARLIGRCVDLSSALLSIVTSTRG
jgi:NitT/TauT family transport system permease protein